MSERVYKIQTRILGRLGMDREIALMVTTTAARARMEIGDLAILLKKHGYGENEEAMRQAIGAAVYEISLLMDVVYKQFPELEQEAEARLEKYGRSFY